MNRKVAVFASCVVLICAGLVFAQDWPQWRGVNRDAKVTGFTAPDTWPEALNKEWEIEVGVGTDATPALVDDKLYVFTRQEPNEVLLCLNAQTGQELWKDSYSTENTTTADRAHAGPRSAPAVADGKIITFGLNGVLTCYDAETEKRLWQKTDYTASIPRFHTAMSPLIEDGMCIGHFGGPENAAVIAYDLSTGDQEWTWEGAGPSYASPAIMTVEDTKTVVVMTESSIVGINIADGSLLWDIESFAPVGRGYNAVTPVIDGQTVYYGGDGGRGVTAVKINKEGDQFVKEQLWTNTDNSMQFNSPVLKDGFLYCMAESSSDFFCINAETGQTAWTEPTETAVIINIPSNGLTVTPAGFGGRGGGMGGGRGGGMRGGRGGMGGSGAGGWGSIVDAGDVLIGLDPTAELVVLEPNGKEYKELASYDLSERSTYAYPVVSGNRIYIMDQTTIALWTIE